LGSQKVAKVRTQQSAIKKLK
jgi:hypothetical protein